MDVHFCGVTRCLFKTSQDGAEVCSKTGRTLDLDMNAYYSIPKDDDSSGAVDPLDVILGRKKPDIDIKERKHQQKQREEAMRLQRDNEILDSKAQRPLDERRVPGRKRTFTDLEAQINAPSVPRDVDMTRSDAVHAEVPGAILTVVCTGESNQDTKKAIMQKEPLFRQTCMQLWDKITRESQQYRNRPTQYRYTNVCWVVLFDFMRTGLRIADVIDIPKDPVISVALRPYNETKHIRDSLGQKVYTTTHNRLISLLSALAPTTAPLAYSQAGASQSEKLRQSMLELKSLLAQ